MADLEGLRVGNAAAVSREALIARLEQTAASGVFRALTSRQFPAGYPKAGGITLLGRAAPSFWPASSVNKYLAAAGRAGEFYMRRRVCSPRVPPLVLLIPSSPW